MLNTPRWSTLTLSKGKVFSNVWQAIRDDFPANADTKIEFFDSSGNIIASVEGEVRERQLFYKIEPPSPLDDVPRGAQYEISIVTEDGPYLFEYGHVARREASFYTPGASLIKPNESRVFIDPFGRNSVGRKWIPIWGQPSMHSIGSGEGQRWGMGPNIGLLFAECAVRYYRPLGGDSFRVKFQVYAVPGSAIGVGGTGKLQAFFGSDITSHIGFGLEIEHGLVNRKVHTGVISAPTDLDYTGTANETFNYDDFITVDYSDIEKIYRVYKNEDILNPIIEWEDTDQELPKGRGYRHFGFAWDASLTATGPLVTAVEIQDYV